LSKQLEPAGIQNEVMQVLDEAGQIERLAREVLPAFRL
jgi:hypothetical protein